MQGPGRPPLQAPAWPGTHTPTHSRVSRVQYTVCSPQYSGCVPVFQSKAAGTRVSACIDTCVPCPLLVWLSHPTPLEWLGRPGGRPAPFGPAGGPFGASAQRWWAAVSQVPIPMQVNLRACPPARHNSPAPCGHLFSLASPLRPAFSALPPRQLRALQRPLRRTVPPPLSACSAPPLFLASPLRAGHRAAQARALPRGRARVRARSLSQIVTQSHNAQGRT